MKDTKTLLLLLVSIGLVSTWAYHLYDKSHYSTGQKEVFITDSLAIQQGINDSLQKMYTATLSKLDIVTLGKDSLTKEFKGKLAEIVNLRNEIAVVLNREGITRADLSKASEKIKVLQQKVAEVSNRNNTLVQEKERLTVMLNQLTQEMSAIQESTVRTAQEKIDLEETVTTGSAFIASELTFKAMNQKSPDKEVPTSKADKTDRFLVSFLLQNNITPLKNAEVFLVLTDPNGTVIQNDQWQSGALVSKKDGVNKYTRKISFQYNKGEQKKIVLPIQLSNYTEGLYSVQVYHNGLKIGKYDLRLN
jgi:FtsZ-binding cell division protein ZapB